MRRKWRFEPRVPRIDDADYAGVLDRLREGLLNIDRDTPRTFTATHPMKLVEIQQKLDAELDRLAERRPS